MWCVLFEVRDSVSSFVESIINDVHCAWPAHSQQYLKNTCSVKLPGVHLHRTSLCAVQRTLESNFYDSLLLQMDCVGFNAARRRLFQMPLVSMVVGDPHITVIPNGVSTRCELYCYPTTTYLTHVPGKKSIISNQRSLKKHTIPYQRKGVYRLCCWKFFYVLGKLARECRVAGSRECLVKQSVLSSTVPVSTVSTIRVQCKTM